MRRSALLLVVLALAGAPAAGAATWTVQPTPNASGQASSALTAVSCPSDTSCIAVGSSANAAGRARALAESWNGSTWTILSLPRIPGSRQTFLNAVSCLSSSWCTAVGGVINHAHKQLTLVEHWNGTHWSVQHTANPSTSLPSQQLQGISCTSRHHCVAVGQFGKERFNPFYTATYHGLIERWNGHHWRVQHVIHAANGNTDDLAAVSCKDPSACIAVGSIDTLRPLAFRWNGHRWRDLHPPNHGGYAGLLGVSCNAAKTCAAVGHYFVSRDQENFAEHWNKGHWKVKTPPRPASTGGAELSSVVCRSAAQCIAVGAAGPADPTGGQAAYWDGLHWTIQATPGGDGWPLSGISCRPTFCIAVGFHGDFTTDSTLAERYG